MIDKKLAPPCGMYCKDCGFLGKQCSGCGYVEGKPFWTSEMNPPICPIYDCCVNNMQLEHCGLCSNLPCKIFLDLRDPSMSEEEFQQSLQQRQSELQKRKDIGNLYKNEGLRQ